MLRKLSPFLLFVLIAIQSCQEKIENINLSGNWSYKLDKNNVGLIEKWQNLKFKDTIQLPSALRDKGIGDNPTLTTEWTGSIYDSTWFFNPAMEKYRKKDSLKFPFWLTPNKHYVGAAWYQKEITIPENWKNKTIGLELERPHWQTQVWLGTVYGGSQNSLSTSHIFTFNQNVKPGKQLLTIRVDNAIRDLDVGINSHSISDHTQGNWNGIIGNMVLYPINEYKINQLKITPNLSDKAIQAKIILNKNTQENLKVSIKVNGLNHEHHIQPSTFNFEKETSEFSFKIPMGNDFKTWSEFNPNLYKIEVTIENENGIQDIKEDVFGMREFTIEAKHFKINGTQISLRGTTECSVFPLTGYPPTDEASWTRIYEICKSFGLNHMRFHSYCPPEAAFIAADKAGIYLQVEGPSWAKYSVSLGNGKPIDNYLMEETKRIIDAYGNHPSFCMMAYGNEPSGNYVPYLENWVSHFKAYDPQRVFTGASTGRSWAIIENSDFIVRSPPRGLEWKDKQPESFFDYRDKTENQNRPYVTFEMGQWCAYPNFDEIKKYTGSLKAKNFELFQEDLKDHHMADQAHDFLMASGKLQASCYKQEIEATLRTPNLAGFQLLSLNDFSGQGTALVGVIDAFWDEKGYISANEFKSFCNDVVPLVRLPKYTFYNNEILTAEVEVANFSGRKLKDTNSTWQLLDEKNTILQSGHLNSETIPIGKGNDLGTINVPLNFATEASKLTLKINVGNYTNQWHIWVYPNSLPEIEDSNIYIAKTLDAKTKQVLEQGGKVLLLAAGKVENGKDIIQYQTPVFWNTSWFKMRPPHTTGMLIKNEHLVFNDFPTDYYSDLQWWEIGNRQQIMNLENFPASFRPIIQPIDTWFLNRRLAMLFEAKVSTGKLMVCSINLNDIDATKPVSKQLYHSILNYLSSEKFNPTETVSLDVISELFEKKERAVWNSYVSENP
ncbi:sugar-binding domain-containing protein [Mariniflexile sp. HNIBRBA6329]|uniref:sugar-binding domain-containing protein n=1 Tax=Mariniflexile sp. HNIBRBA6329 TaxID=3373088 RepID=UPI003745C19D